MLHSLSFRAERGLPETTRVGQGISPTVINTAEIPSTSSGQALRVAQDDRMVAPFFGTNSIRRRRINSAFCILHSAFSGGFTLIELLMVIAVIAIIIGLSSPAFMGLGRGAGMNGAVTSVRSTLQLLRQWAITHREEITFYYFASVAPTASYYYAANDADVIIEKTNELPMEVMFRLGGGITFRPDGGLPGCVSTNIIIDDRKFSGDDSKAKTISINGLTGGIKVE